MNYAHPIDKNAFRWVWSTREEDHAKRRQHHDPAYEPVPLTHRKLEDCPPSDLYSPQQVAMATINSLLRVA